MRCVRCGAILREDAVVCPICETAVPAAAQTADVFGMGVKDAFWADAGTNPLAGMWENPLEVAPGMLDLPSAPVLPESKTELGEDVPLSKVTNEQQWHGGGPPAAAQGWQPAVQQPNVQPPVQREEQPQPPWAQPLPQQPRPQPAPQPQTQRPQAVAPPPPPQKPVVARPPAAQRPAGPPLPPPNVHVMPQQALPGAGQAPPGAGQAQPGAQWHVPARRDAQSPDGKKKLATAGIIAGVVALVLLVATRGAILAPLAAVFFIVRFMAKSNAFKK